MTDDTSFDTEIRAMLARRDPRAAPPGLAGVVTERLRSDRGPSIRLARVRPLANAVVGLAAAVLLAVVISARSGTSTPIGPSSSPSSERPVLVAGAGISESVQPPLVQLGFGAICVLGLAAVAVRTSRRLVGYAAVTGILGIVWVASTIGGSDALRAAGGSFGVDPFLERPEGFTEGIFVRAEGDEEFRIFFTIANDSRLPLEILGMVSTTRNDEFALNLPRLVGLGYVPMDQCCLVTNARSFTRMTLEPGESVQLVALGRAGKCATSVPAAGASVIEFVPLVYEQLTILHTADVPLDEGVDILGRSPC